jgi:hypothetical protein
MAFGPASMEPARAGDPPNAFMLNVQYLPAPVYLSAGLRLQRFQHHFHQNTSRCNLGYDVQLYHPLRRCLGMVPRSGAFVHASGLRRSTTPAHFGPVMKFRLSSRQESPERELPREPQRHVGRRAWKQGQSRVFAADLIHVGRPTGRVYRAASGGQPKSAERALRSPDAAGICSDNVANAGNYM